MALLILAVGENPNLCFYAWRLQSTQACSVSVVSTAIDVLAPVRWQSELLGDSVFQPDFLANSLAQLDPQRKYDVVLLSVSNLQSFQDTCTAVAPLLHADALVVVESTGYVQLEPFVVSSLPSKAAAVCSIMNEADVRRFPYSNTFVHAVLNQDQRIYLGSCTPELKAAALVRDLETYAQFYKLLQKVQEHLSGHVSLLRSSNPQEFMTYQWKLALPRIVLNPLLVLFEEPFPARLSKQILAKPLISGLVNELFKIIKKMGCKLIKGYENEANIMKNWLAHFPVADAPASPEFRDSNTVFYSFFHQMDVDVDLLLLQPILLGDDHAVRTPYLENLYSIVCQLLKMNATESVFFTRKHGSLPARVREMDVLLADLANLKTQRDTADAQYRDRQLRMQQLETSLSQRQQAQDELVRKFEEQTRLYDSKIDELARIQQQREAAVAELDSNLQGKSSMLQSLEARVMQAEAAWTQQQQSQQHRLEPALKTLAGYTDGIPDTEANAQAPLSSSENSDMEAPKSRTYALLEMQSPDLSDLSHVAVYGAALNGDVGPPATRTPSNSVSKPGPPHASGDLSEKEKELQRREQALAQRERELRTSLLQAPGTQRELYYDAQSAEQLHDSSLAHPVQPAYQAGVPANDMPGSLNNGQNNFTNGGYSNGQHNPNGGFNNGQNGFNNGGQNLRPPFAPTGPHTYSQQYEAMGHEQRPPHGLPPNGFPQNSLPPTLRNPQRYQQNGALFNPQMQPQRPRILSHASGPASVNYAGLLPPQNNQAHNNAALQSAGPQNMQHRSNSLAFQQQMPMGQQQMPMGHQQMPMGQQQMPMGHQQMQSQGSLQYLVNQTMHAVPQGYPAKKGSRRSAFPDQALNIDYGGRGGMPMPAANGGKPKHATGGGHIPQSSPPIGQARKSYLGANLARPGLDLGFPRAVNQNVSSNSNSLTSHASISEDSPKPSTPDSLKDIRLDVPVAEVPAKPLGGIAPPPEEKKKKKRSFLKKH
ncbi:hypothetical protein METBIDRAFT_11568 [Metschnikowia bicuspidata var. bicuspidata NRRL YB-4993]|uniref:Ketopantoate reductase C-terminal domain-containing protein n=1 Tax=Metschnikowia bicuspidata var. bicuspidata NRRL YB-4993 TaxID=869754 RepID=A0A1A0HAR2_9ASCO|nr:hypothetical protein METBIDRAFT_11568 [Metschnikowia bicuspidata var. bicuspidata NRRL YB-4993]OBA20973.1 hypothetical protein METBIDRAFT_11568 [Metschnikowia bicuspidata var. bicuspidata NRRL YB-4993]